MNINLNIAVKYANAGLSVIPTELVSKGPYHLLPWKEYTAGRADESKIRKWFAKDDAAIGLICGAVSDMTEIIDIDNHFEDASQIYQDMRELLDNTSPGIWEKLTVETTQSGGYHLIYKASAQIEGPQKLARRPKFDGTPDILIETRGEGSYAIVAPSTGYELIQGRISALNRLTDEERNILISAAKSFNEYIEPGVYSEVTETKGFSSGDGKPGDDFNARGSVRGTLESNGWTLVRVVGDVEHWRRPGKNRGISATFNSPSLKNRNYFYVFSSAAPPFEDRHSYAPFAVEALLNHNGDYSACARALIAAGYGSPAKNGDGAVRNKSKFNGKSQDAAVSADGKLTGRLGEMINSDVEVANKDNVIHIIQSYLNSICELRYNVIRTVAEYKLIESDEWLRISDRFVNEVWRTLKADDKKVSKQAVQNILESEYVKPYHPFADFFGNLPPWDSTDHITEFAKLIKVPDDQEPIWLTYCYKWMVGLVANALERGLNHSCIVLVGPQGVGKTSIINKLIPPELQSYYACTQLNPSDKDSKILLTESFLINLDELESSTREEIGYLKSLMTIEQLTVRKPYGRYTETFKRRASFIGSVNKCNFLTDITGSRRFLTVDVESIDLLKQFDVYQIYSQALFELNNGFKYWFDGQEIEKINEQNQNYQIVSAEEEFLNKNYKPYILADPKNFDLKDINVKVSNNLLKFMTATDILNEMQENTKIRLNLTKLGLLLKKLGYQQIMKKINGKMGRAYLIAKADTNEDYQESAF